MGFRLPLDSLPWVPEAERPRLYAPDPMQRFADLRPYGKVLFQQNGAGARAEQSKEAPGIARTALCVEPRNGVLYVFMPPAEALEDYLELVAAVEASAVQLGSPVVLKL